MTTTYRIDSGLTVLADFEPIPGRGVLPIQAFLLEGRQPILVDAGAVRHRDRFLAALERVVDPADLAWIVLTHPDHDHMGALGALLDRAPKARLVANWVSTGKLSAALDVPPSRLQWVNPGEALVAAGRVLHFLRPPMYDCPSTTAIFDAETRALLSSDAFGAVVSDESRSFAELREADALDGMSFFCRVNSPWLSDLNPERYERSLRALSDLAPSWLLSSHLPPVPADLVDAVFARATALPGEGRVPLPGQRALEAALASAAQAA